MTSEDDRARIRASMEKFANVRLEPNIVPEGGALPDIARSVAELSIAISLKRIADALELSAKADAAMMGNASVIGRALAGKKPSQ